MDSLLGSLLGTTTMPTTQGNGEWAMFGGGRHCRDGSRTATKRQRGRMVDRRAEPVIGGFLAFLGRRTPWNRHNLTAAAALLVSARRRGRRKTRSPDDSGRQGGQKTGVTVTCCAAPPLEPRCPVPLLLVGIDAGAGAPRVNADEAVLSSRNGQR
jgi:hypothetical protein